MADSSGFTPQERHNIINEKLTEYKKKSKVFHMRWTPGDLLDGKILSSTPAFWYMRFGWSRQEIEGLFYAARVYIDSVFESSLDAVFGIDGKGPRWLPPEMQEEERGKWNRRQYYKTQPWWKVKALGDINAKGQINKSYKDEPYAYDKESQNKDKYGQGANGQGGDWSKSNTNMNEAGRRRSILNTKLEPNAEKIWQKASNYGNKNDKINYKQFQEGLKANNINIDEDTAKKLFEIYADKDGFMDYNQFLELLRKLDQTEVKAGVDIGPISLKDLGPNLQTQLFMKRVLLAAAMDMPFNVTDFLSGNITGSIGNPGLLLGKLATRDADWQERMNIMENIANNLGTNPEYDRFLEPEHASDLIMGWTAQMLDTKQPVSKTAIDQLPTVFHEIADKSHPDVAMAHLDDVIDGLFNVMDNKKHDANHDAAKKALKDIVDDVVHNQDAEAVLYLAGLLGEKTKIENCTDPDARAAALDNIKRIMMGDNSKAMDPNKMPNKADDPNKEWLDTGVGKKDGPSQKLMEQGKDNPNNIKTYFPNGIDDKDLIDSENNNLKGKKGAVAQKSGVNDANGPNAQWGGNKENYGTGPRGDKFGPNNEDETDEDGNNKYGGTDQPDTPMSEYGSEPDDPKRKKGKQNDVTLKFGKNKNDDPNADPNGNPNNSDDSKYNDPNGSGNKNGGGDNGDLDDSGNPNDPGNKNNKRGGTKRKGTNGKNDFDGKFGDDSKKQSPYGNGRIGSGAPQNDPNNPNNNNNPQNNGNGNAPNDGDEKQAPMTSKEVGDEFRDVVADAVSNALMDPNKKNKDDGAKLADTLNELAPNNFPETLNGEAKKKYLNWKKGPLKPYEKKLPPKNKPLPGLTAGTAKVHTISGNQQVTIKPPTIPDI